MQESRCRTSSFVSLSRERERESWKNKVQSFVRTIVIEEKFEKQGDKLNRCRVNRSRKLEIIWPSCRPKWLNYGGRETGKALGNIRSESRANSSLLHQRVRRHCPHETPPTSPSLHLPRLDLTFLETFLIPSSSLFTTF